MKGGSEEDVLYELLLKRGVELTIPIESREVASKTVYSIGYGVLFACLDEFIDKAEIEALGQGIIDWHAELEPASDTQVVFRDSSFCRRYCQDQYDSESGAERHCSCAQPLIGGL